jgi:hypothetical protein
VPPVSVALRWAAVTKEWELKLVTRKEAAALLVREAIKTVVETAVE